MSQRKDCFPMIDKAADVKGLVLRPLSAKFLPVTIPEEEGLINREMLYDFTGRSRKPQMALACELGLTEYPMPAGGCLLTEPIYAFKLKDLLTYNNSPEYKDINLLRVGRHFRFSPECKIIVGRDNEENEAIKSLGDTKDCLLRVEGVGSPLTIIRGKVTDEALHIAASLCARYSDAKKLPEATVAIISDNKSFYLNVKPADNAIIDNYRIEKKGTVAKLLRL